MLPLPLFLTVSLAVSIAPATMTIAIASAAITVSGIETRHFDLEDENLVVEVEARAVPITEATFVEVACSPRSSVISRRILFGGGRLFLGIDRKGGDIFGIVLLR